MGKQKEMVESFLISHREFMTNLGKSLAMLEKNVAEAAKGKKICIDEWCIAT